jgi:isopenicillin N synthase-like dioxygenase
VSQVTKESHLVGGYEGFRFYDLAKTGDAGKKGEEDNGDGGWNEGFAIAPEWGTNCFPKAFVDSEKNNGASPSSDPFDPVAFEATCKAYFYAIQELGRHVLGMIAEGLGVERDFFEGYLENQNSFCRLTHYYRAEEEGEGKGNTGAQRHDPDKVEIGAAPHTGEMAVYCTNLLSDHVTDWGALTLLVQDLVGGLQVYDRHLNQWHDVRAPWAFHLHH